MRHIALASSIMLGFVAAPAFAGILVVDAANGPGTNSTNLQTAANAAADGDTLLVRAGTYPALNIFTKSLLVVADTGAAVHVSSTIRVRLLGPQQFVLLRGIDGTGSGVVDACGIVVEDCQGPVWLDDCAFIGINGYNGLRQQDARLVSTHHTYCLGAEAVPSPSPEHGGWGAFIQNGVSSAPTSQLRAWDSTFLGGRGGDGNPQAAAGTGGMGIYASGGSDIRLEAVVAQGGPGGDMAFSGSFAGLGGHGVNVGDGQNTPFAVAFRDSTLIGGKAGKQLAHGAKPGVDGKPIEDSFGLAVALAGAARHYDATSPGRAGFTVGLTFAGLPNDVVFLFAASGPTAQPLSSSAIDGPLMLPLPLTLLATIPLGPTGQLATSANVPQLPPGFDTVTVWTQALFVSGNSAVAANGNAITLLAAGF